MEEEIRIRRVGDSLGVIIPSNIVGKYNLNEGDYIKVKPKSKNYENEIAKGNLILRETYYRNGFFNTNKTFPLFPCKEGFKDIKITLCLGDKSKKINAVVKYKGLNGEGTWINNSHKPRIYGGKVLAKWFQKNFQVNDSIMIIQLSDIVYLLRK